MNRNKGKSQLMNRYQEIFKIVFIYAIFGCAWIYFSDSVLGWLVNDSEMLTQLAIFKGVLFVLITSVLLYFLINRMNNKIRSSVNALEESEGRLSFLVKNSSDCLIVINPDGSQRYVSPAAERLTGFSIAELEGKKFENLIHPDDIKDVMAAWHEVLQNPRKTATVQYRHIHKTQGWVISEAIAQSFLTEPTINGVIASVRDITKRKKAEDELRKSEAHFRTLVQAIPDLVWLKDKDGIYLSCNKIFERLFGAREKDIVGKTDYDFVDKELADFFKENDEKAIAAGRPSINEESVTFVDDGRNVLLETIKTPIYDSDGSLIGVLGVGRDITERKRTEEALQNYTFLMREMGKAAKIGGWEFEVETGRGTWTEEVARIHEVDPEQATNAELGINFYTDESKKLIIKAIQDAIEFQKPYVLELELITAKGNYKWIRTIGYPFVENNKVVKVRGSFQDITERKKADEEREKLQIQLTQAQKMESVGRLAGGVAHDFNNMLGVIQGYSEMILEETAENESIHSALLEIQKATQRSVDLTRQLLAFARKQTVAPKVLNLNDTVEGMLTMLRRLIGEDIELVWLPGKKLGLIKMDPSQVDQIMANLCVNARDAINDTGRVTVETCNVVLDETYQAQHANIQPGNYVQLAVSDNGCGMDEETRERLFEPFFTTKEQGKGTGLGLASIYGIVKQNNGFINIYSEPNLGTTFKIYLPMYETEVEQPHQKVQLSTVGGNETILLVEDELAILTMTTRMLERLGYNVLTANTAAAAINLAQNYSDKIHLLITDVIMPEMNGRTLADQLLLTYPTLKSLFMSGYTSNIIAQHGVLAEGVFFIQKPFTKQDLAIKVREALHKNDA